MAKTGRTVVRGWSSALCTAILLVAGLAVAGPAQAATITVTTTADDYNLNVGSCSLREAITAANTDAAFGGCPAGSGDDVIQLQALTYTLDELGAQENANVTGDLDILADSTINGPSTGFATIDANDIDRVFDVRILSCATSTSCVTMNRLIVEDGTAGSGGGVTAVGLTFTNGIIRNNTASAGGGADVVRSTFIGSTIEDNTADVGGGLRSNDGDLTLIRTRVDGNDATDDQESGGGIWIEGNLSVTDSAVTFNTSQGSGGGISAINLLGTTVTLTRTRVSNNSADRGGGGLHVDEVEMTAFPVDVVDSAITNNSADLDGVDGGVGGGILNGTAFRSPSLERP